MSRDGSHHASFLAISELREKQSFPQQSPYFHFHEPTDRLFVLTFVSKADSSMQRRIVGVVGSLQ
jgi:hypothetical protein